MDFSKLPKLSETKPEPSAVQPPVAAPLPPREIVIGAEIWICFIVGIFLLYWCNRPLEYLFTRAHPENFTWTFEDEHQNPIGYLQSVFFLVDLGGCALGAIMIFDGLQMLLARSVKFVMLALALTIGAIVLNVAAMIACFIHGSGFQIINFLAIVLGGYIAIYQWNAVQRLRYLNQLDIAK